MRYKNVRWCIGWQQLNASEKALSVLQSPSRLTFVVVVISLIVCLSSAVWLTASKLWSHHHQDLEKSLMDAHAPLKWGVDACGNTPGLMDCRDVVAALQS